MKVHLPDTLRFSNLHRLELGKFCTTWFLRSDSPNPTVSDHSPTPSDSAEVNVSMSCTDELSFDRAESFEREPTSFGAHKESVRDAVTDTLGATWNNVYAPTTNRDRGYAPRPLADNSFRTRPRPPVARA